MTVSDCKTQKPLCQCGCGKRIWRGKKFIFGHQNKRSPEAIRGWIRSRTKVNDKGCWIWCGQKRSANSKYGCVTYENRTQAVHRVSYVLFKGEIPEGLFVCHECDTPLCVNPEHLWLGTAKDNRQDCCIKGRANIRSGESSPNAKFTQADVDEIRRLNAIGEMNHREIATMFGTTRGHVYQIVHYLRWRVEKAVS